MEDSAIVQFKRDFIIQTLVHQSQFEQWFKITFYLNDRLQNEYDIVYQDAFYVKLYEALTTGLKYAIEVHDSLVKGNNLKKTLWFKELIEGLKQVRSCLTDSEFLYLEYRRHCTSHMFQTQYEHIQDDFRIKKIRNNKNLSEIKAKLENEIIKHGSDKDIDEYLNKKLQPLLTKIYNNLNQ